MTHPLPSAPWLRYLLAAAVLAALLALALWPARHLVDHATVQQGTVRESFEAEGRARMQQRFVLSAPVAGVVERLEWEPGERVQAGQVLVRLRPLASPALDARSRAQAQAQAAAAQSAYAAAQAETAAAAQTAQLAASAADRAEALAAQGMVSTAALQQAQAQREASAQRAQSAQWSQGSARYQRDAARAALLAHDPARPAEAALLLRAPIDGVLLRRHLQSERAVALGEPILELGKPQALEAEADVLSADAVRLRPGMAVELLRWGGPATLQAEVQRIEPAAFTQVSALGVQEQRVRVWLALRDEPAAWAGLGEGYRVQARFVLRAVPEALYLPSAAVFRHGGTNGPRTEPGWAVYRIEGQRARLQAVQLGLQGEGRVQVLAGLQAGDQVVLHPPRQLSDGARLRLR
ncbi:efflux RND transporter periplasmic adaptor subunit [Serpentinimonas barnesii]|uniref:efflux RND transporter periplasmic adaptor subunit n=1 Tax=Serpentinimonas barnesii TaxID=1458427 RepID=UPI0005ED8F9C|nr:efflux RND transporter periplasmic adaptor subunit [Serpentinimonas barnesii]